MKRTSFVILVIILAGLLPPTAFAQADGDKPPKEASIEELQPGYVVERHHDYGKE